MIFLLLVASGVFYWGEQQGGVGNAWIYLDRFGLILGIVAFVPIIYAVHQYWQYLRGAEEERKRIHSETGTQPAVLIVSIGGASIRNSVEAFLKEQKDFKNFDFDNRVFVVHNDKKIITAEDVDSVIQEVEEKQNKIREKAADKVHLFVKAPSPISVILGAILANQTPTLIYHYQNKYENWGALRR